MMISMSLCFKNNTHFVCCLQRVITPLLNHHTRAVTTSRHHHHLGLVALNLTSRSEVRTPTSKLLEKLPASTSLRPPIPIGMTTRPTLTRRLPNVGSHGSNPTPTSTS